MLPGDPGPIYTETNLARFPVEPWNTSSNLIFLAIAIYFWRKIKLDDYRHPFVSVALPILILGFIGGTLYHATRNSRLWLLLDFVPIFVLGIAAAVYFWHGVTHSRWLAALLVGAFIFISRSVIALSSLPHSARITAGYVLLAVMIILPALLHSARHGWRNVALVLGSVLSFGGAAYFRYADSLRLLPMGTHFIWHLLGGVSTFLLMRYIYLAEIDEAAREVPLITKD
ncbi:MAG: ceramidase [Oligoflexia bacterium]|nr:ceramidase [Oligoflexia bacterium]